MTTLLRRLNASACGRSLEMTALCSSSSSASLTTSCVASTAVLLNSVRHRAMRVKIANRSTVERFHAQRYILPTRLETAAPMVAMEWDHEKNPLHVYPKILGVGSLEPRWWKCSQCSHSYSASPEQRVLRGHGCPQCAKGDGEAVQPSKKVEKKKKKSKGSSSVQRKNKAAALDEGVLSGERNPNLRPVRGPLFTVRTKY